MNYMQEGNAVKVTNENHLQFNNIGVIIERDTQSTEFVLVAFTMNELPQKMNVSSLLDMTLKYND